MYNESNEVVKNFEKFDLLLILSINNNNNNEELNSFGNDELKTIILHYDVKGYWKSL